MSSWLWVPVSTPSSREVHPAVSVLRARCCACVGPEGSLRKGPAGGLALSAEVAAALLPSELWTRTPETSPENTPSGKQGLLARDFGETRRALRARTRPVGVAGPVWGDRRLRSASSHSSLPVQSRVWGNPFG